MIVNHARHCDRSAEEMESELRAISDREKELRNSTRHIDEEFWQLTQRKLFLHDRLQQLREKQHRKDKGYDQARQTPEMESELQALRRENRQLSASLEQQRTTRDGELEEEKVAAKKQATLGRNALQLDRMIRKDGEETRRQMANDRRYEHARHAPETEREWQAVRHENQRLFVSLDQQRGTRDDEVEQLREDPAAMKERSILGRNALQLDRMIREQCEETKRQMSSVSRDLESLRRIHFNLRNQRAAVEAMATETQLRQLNQLKNKSTEIEQLIRRLSFQHQHRQQQLQRQLRDAELQHLGN